MNPMVAGAGVQLGLASELYQSINGISEVLLCMFELGLRPDPKVGASCACTYGFNRFLCAGK